MIEILDQIESKLKHGEVTQDEWDDWEGSKATKIFKTQLKEKLIDALSGLITTHDKHDRLQSEIKTLDYVLNYKPGNCK